MEAVSLIKVELRGTACGFHTRGGPGRRCAGDPRGISANLCAEVHQEFGDVEAAFKKCDPDPDDTFINKRQDAAFLEPSGCIADYDNSGHRNALELIPGAHMFKGRSPWC